MLLHRGLTIAVLGVATYALYKTGTLNAVAKTVAKAGTKATKWSKEQIEKLNKEDCSTETASAVAE